MCANLIVTEEQLNHLVLRAKERVVGLTQHYPKDYEKKAKEHITNAIQILQNQIPNDWRFTMSPTAKFIIAYQPEEGIDYRILGRTYRDNKKRDGQSIVSSLESLYQSDRSKDENNFKEPLDTYIKLVICPDCDIFHELKTIYKKGEPLSDEMNIYTAMLKEVPYSIPLPPRRLSTRPNAVITSENEIWVRQSEMLDLSSESRSDYKEYLYFEKLTPDGIDKSIGRIYTFDKQGNLKFKWEITNGIASSLFKKTILPEKPNYRSQSYWILPTYVDATYLDLLYLRIKYPLKFCFSLEDLVLFSRLETLIKSAAKSLGLYAKKDDRI